ncbi:MAG TPA: DUF3788 family protein [Opitutaceae bacterium]|nr:DUF3788 family protein [Opitutaceae bacterium]
MKTTLHPLADAAFPDEQSAPDPDEIEDLLASAPFAGIARFFAWLDRTYPAVASEWKYSPHSGWYEIPHLHGRRLCYFIPKQQDFRLNVVLGDRAILSLARTEHAKAVTHQLKGATRYPEGTLFSFDRHTFDCDLVIALLAAKLHH